MAGGLNLFWDDGELIGGSLDDVGPVVHALDGRTRTVVLIELTGMSIGIGGGADDKVLAYYTHDDWDFYNLVGDALLTGSTELVAGGQPGNYPNKNLVSRATALEAVTELIEGNELTFTWEKQETNGGH